LQAQLQATGLQVQLAADTSGLVAGEGRLDELQKAKTEAEARLAKAQQESEAAEERLEAQEAQAGDHHRAIQAAELKAAQAAQRAADSERKLEDLAQALGKEWCEPPQAAPLPPRPLQLKDRVRWSMADKNIPAGEIGSIISWKGSDKAMVQFTKGTFLLRLSELSRWEPGAITPKHVRDLNADVYAQQVEVLSQASKEERRKAKEKLRILDVRQRAMSQEFKTELSTKGTVGILEMERDQAVQQLADAQAHITDLRQRLRATAFPPENRDGPSDKSSVGYPGLAFAEPASSQ